MKTLIAALALAGASSVAFAVTPFPDIGRIAPLSGAMNTSFETTKSNAFGFREDAVGHPAMQNQAPIKLSQIMIKVQWPDRYAGNTNFLFVKNMVPVDSEISDSIQTVTEIEPHLPPCSEKSVGIPELSAFDPENTHAIKASFLPLTIDEQGASLAITTLVNTSISDYATNINGVCMIYDTKKESHSLTRKDHFDFNKTKLITLDNDVTVSITVTHIPGA
jgi:hypothetical protein